MNIEIWSDIACPWCYIGKRRFERALVSFTHRDEVEVVWRSFELDPTARRSYPESQAERLAAKYRVPLDRAKEMDATMTAEAKKEGLDFRFDRVRVGNTFDAHRLIHFAATEGRRDAMVERLFGAYLTDGEAIGEPEVLVRLATDVGLDADATREMLDSAAFTSAVRADEERAHSFGVTGVPFFAIDERYGVSGAQPPEALLDALRQAWSETAESPSTSPGTSPGAATVAASATSTTSAALEECEDGSCAI
ncbi:MAG: DsbA family oxidoreductase [Gemmatimonadaceae bacterium]